MHHQLLLTALVLFDRLLDPECGEIEHYEIDAEIATLRRLMPPADNGYYQAILDVCDVAHAI